METIITTDEKGTIKTIERIIFDKSYYLRTKTQTHLIYADKLNTKFWSYDDKVYCKCCLTNISDFDKNFKKHIATKKHINNKLNFLHMIIKMD